MSLWERSQEAAEVIACRSLVRPEVAIVLGSGLGGWVDQIDDSVVIPYTDVPHLKSTGVAGHQGRIVLGKVNHVPVLVYQGRLHHYEGHDLVEVTFPIRIVQQLGISTLILTGATGGVNSSFRKGDLVLLNDHINLIGENPLRGPHDERLGLRFPDMTQVYSARLRQIGLEIGLQHGLRVHEGVYAAMPGPCYETPAEVRMLQALGADVVGMSIVPEAIVARHAGLDLIGLAVVCNPAAGLSEEVLDHEQVQSASRDALKSFGVLLTGLIPHRSRFPQENGKTKSRERV